MSRRIRRGALPLALLLAACAGKPDRSELVPIGGPWYFRLRSHLPEAGWVPVDLYRHWKGKPVLVGPADRVRAVAPGSGADPSVRDNDGQTAADRMRASRDPELLG